MFTNTELEALRNVVEDGNELNYQTIAETLNISVAEVEQRLKDSPDKVTENLEEELPIVHWTRIQTNKFKYSLKLGMLLEQGFTQSFPVAVEGEKRGKQYAKMRRIQFDKDYVLEKIIMTLINPLSKLPKEQLLQIVGEAYDKREKDNEKEINIYKVREAIEISDYLNERLEG